jgi:hypothetical protein
MILVGGNNQGNALPAPGESPDVYLWDGLDVAASSGVTFAVQPGVADGTPPQFAIDHATYPYEYLYKRGMPGVFRVGADVFFMCLTTDYDSGHPAGRFFCELYKLNANTTWSRVMSTRRPWTEGSTVTASTSINLLAEDLPLLNGLPCIGIMESCAADNPAQARGLATIATNPALAAPHLIIVRAWNTAYPADGNNPWVLGWASDTLDDWQFRVLPALAGLDTDSQPCLAFNEVTGKWMWFARGTGLTGHGRRIMLTTSDDLLTWAAPVEIINRGAAPASSETYCGQFFRHGRRWAGFVPILNSDADDTNDNDTMTVELFSGSADGATWYDLAPGEHLLAPSGSAGTWNQWMMAFTSIPFVSPDGTQLCVIAEGHREAHDDDTVPNANKIAATTYRWPLYGLRKASLTNLGTPGSITLTARNWFRRSVHVVGALGTGGITVEMQTAAGARIADPARSRLRRASATEYALDWDDHVQIPNANSKYVVNLSGNAWVSGVVAR